MAHAHEHDDDARKNASRRRGSAGPVGQQVVDEMSTAGRMPQGVRLGGQFDPEETAADEVARRVMAEGPKSDDASIIAAARRAGARVPSGVRIHQGGRANAAAASMQASAFTVGNDVYLTDEAVRRPEQRIQVLAHELTHTGQDRGHGTHSHAGEPVVQRLWNPFKKKTTTTPTTTTPTTTTPTTTTPTPPHTAHQPKASEEEAESREDSNEEEFRGAVTESPLSATDPFGGVSSGEHDSTAYKIGDTNLDDSWKGPEIGDDGWGGHKGALSNDAVDSWSQSHQSDANNMGFASTLGTETFGDIGGGIFSALDAKNKKGVDAGLAGTKAGASGLKGITDLGSLSFQGVKNYGHSSLSTDQLNQGQAGFDHASGWLGGITGGVGMAQDLKSWGSDTVDWFKGKRNFEKVKKDASGNYDKVGMAKQVGLSMGRGLGKLGSAANKGIGAVSKSANLAAQGAHTAGNLGVASQAASVGGALAHTLAPMQMALGGVDVIKGGYNIFRKGQHRAKLTAMKDAIKGKKGTLDPEKDNKLSALDHLTEVAKKKQIRQGINMATGAAGVLGGALTVSGFGALPGAIIGGGVGAFKLGQLGARKAKQKGRDWAEKYNAKAEDQKGWLGKKVAGIFDTSKSTSKKEARYEKTADTLLGMTGDEQTQALKTLGIHDLASVDAADRKALIVEKLKKRS